MCLIVFAWKAHPVYPLVMAANRDEYFNRPSLPLDYWEELPDVLGGRDVEKGGSWFATHTDGRWAAVTNFREGTASSPGRPSRGHLVMNYLASTSRAGDYVEQLSPPLTYYPGCNLLVADDEALFFVSNRWQGSYRAGAQPVEPGVHGLSNHSLDTPWPKVVRTTQALSRLLQSDLLLEPDRNELTTALFDMLADRRPANDDALPSTGIPQEWERTLSAPFIVSDKYGTRASTVVLMDNEGNITVQERSFATAGIEQTHRAFSYRRGQRRH